MSFITKTPIKAIAREYNLKSQREEVFFDKLWELFQIGNKYKKEHKEDIERSLRANYMHMVAVMLGKSEFTIDMRNPMVPNPRIRIQDNVFKRVKTINLQPRKARIRRVTSMTRARGGTLGTITGKEGVAARGSDTLQLAMYPEAKHVIFSDHHLTESGHSHDYFRRWNKGIYKDVLRWYADHDYGLIENGDVEEYTIFEPSNAIVNRYENLIQKGPLQDIGSISWQQLNQERISNRVNILTNILSDNQDLYDLVEEKFARKGRRYYTRITGNHDPYFSSRLTNLLPENIRKNLCDALRINYRNEAHEIVKEPKYVVTHGHQFDAATLPQHAFAIGEVFSETLGWFIQGADRIWNPSKTNQWRNPQLQSDFRNILATAESNADLSSGVINAIGEAVLEALLQNHEIAWEYFDRPSKVSAVTDEVLTGDEYFKVRHLSETELVAKMDYYHARTELKNFRKRTKLIIGHTHEPRINSRRATNDGRLISHYLNTGSAGRFAKFIWGIELVDGEEKVISWTKSGQQLVRNQWQPTGDGRLVKMEYPL